VRAPVPARREAESVLPTAGSARPMPENPQRERREQRHLRAGPLGPGRPRAGRVLPRAGRATLCREWRREGGDGAAPVPGRGISPRDFDAAVAAGRSAVAGERVGDPGTAASRPIAVALMLDPE